MMHLQVIYLVIGSVITQDYSICKARDTCNQCIQASYLCAWCEDITFQADRCGSEEVLRKLDCTIVTNPKTKILVTSRATGTYFTINPRRLDVQFRKDEEINFNISISLHQYLPTQTVISIDFSNSMGPAWSIVKESVENFTNLITAAGGATIGVSKFVDKLSFPIIDPFSYDVLNPGAPVYFEIISKLTSNAATLITDLNKQVLSTNLDIPEAAFNAVVQSAVCKAEMGWVDDVNTLKTIVLITDEVSKSAGDGKIVGVIAPDNLLCHEKPPNLNVGGMRYDFPSVGQTGYVLRNNRIGIIIATSDSARLFYEEVLKSWNGVNGVVTKIDFQGFDLLKILEDSRKKLYSRIELYHLPTDDLSINVVAHCPSNNPENSGYICNGVNLGDDTSYSLKIKYIKSPTGVTMINFFISTLATIEFAYEEIRQCPCSNSGSNRSVCNDHGNLVCGKCECDNEWAGRYCSCEKGGQDIDVACIDPHTSTVCNNQGTCDECGECSCDVSPFGGVYIGVYCECDPSQCQSFDGQICGGPERGKCVCSACECEQAYTGYNCGSLNCEDSETEKRCINQSDESPCSGYGACICGKCRCNVDRSGEFCEQRSIPYTCTDFVDDVRCFLFHNSSQPDLNCDTIQAKLQIKEEESYKCLEIIENGCTIYFNFEVEEDITIYVKSFDSKNDCPKPLNVPLILGLVFGGVLLAGFLIIGAYLLTVYLYHKADYKKFMKDQQKNAGLEKINPLYETTAISGVNPS